MACQAIPQIAPYRALTAAEIATLQRQGCAADDWEQVLVADTFDPSRLRDVRFSGTIRLGACRENVQLPGGLIRPSGIERAVLHDCTVGHNVWIHNIGRYIAGLDIGDDVVIDNAALLATDFASLPEGEAFGLGVRTDVLNEAGGRDVRLYERMSSHVAYIWSMYRHRPDVVESLESLVEEATIRRRGERGYVGRGAVIVDCGPIVNCCIGEGAYVGGACRLTNGTIVSSPQAPAHVGEGVVAERFILDSGSRLESGANIKSTFIGQGARVGRQFVAEHSLIFANSDLQQGEAVSVLAGPYTVSHHKSSLLIAGLYSFFNAGSGTNYSNHMYKLGPLHQGVLERGCKTGSSCYVLWPARVGAFTAVLGRHATNLDTTAFPFSYLMEVGGRSVLIPAANFYTSGTRRDLAKWPQRDRRTDSQQRDLLHYDALNPCTAGRMLQGREILLNLANSVAPDQELVEYRGARIPCSRIHKAMATYDMALAGYLHGRVAARLEKVLSAAGGQVRQRDVLKALISNGQGQGPWCDLAGLLAPQSAVDRLLDDIGTRRLDLPGIELRLRQIYEQFVEDEWDWVRTAWAKELGRELEEISLADLASSLEQWKAVSRQCNDWVLRDAQQEFLPQAQVGYGLDDPKSAAADFAAVRGTFDSNEFVVATRAQTQATTAAADRLLLALGRVRR